MKMVGYDELNKSITERALWWKSYKGHVIDEIRQLRGRVSGGIKASINEGKIILI